MKTFTECKSTQLRLSALMWSSIIIASLTVQSQSIASSLPAVNFSTFSGTFTPVDPANVGWQFSTNSSTTVTHLGYYDFDQDGLNTSHEVAIWTNAGALVTSATVSPSDPLDGGFRYTSIPSVALASGATYVIGAVTGGSDKYGGVGSNPFSTHPNINYLEGRFDVSTVLTFPTGPAFQEPSIFGPSFKIDTIPEPATLALAGLGLSLISLRGWHWLAPAYQCDEVTRGDRN